MSISEEALTELLESKISVPLNGDFGEIVVSFDPDSKPLWHGKLSFGTLTIYKTSISGRPTYPIVSFFHVLQNAKILGPGNETDAAYTVYRASYSIQEVVNRLIQNVQENYMNLIQEEISERKCDGTYSLQ